MEVSQDPPKETGFHLAPTPIILVPNAKADFPASLCVDQKYDLEFLRTNMS